MPSKSDYPSQASDDLMPDAAAPASMVWAAAVALAAAAVIGLVMGLRQAPAIGGGAFGDDEVSPPTAASASATSAKPLTGDKWSTLNGPQVIQPAPDSAKLKPAAIPPSGQPAAARSAASVAAPPETSQPQAPPIEPEPQQAPANSSQPDSIQNYY